MLEEQQEDKEWGHQRKASKLTIKHAVFNAHYTTAPEEVGFYVW